MIFHHNIFSPLFVKSKMDKKLHEICKKQFQIAKINVRLLQNVKCNYCKMQNVKCNCKIRNANELVFKKVYRDTFSEFNLWVKINAKFDVFESGEPSYHVNLALSVGRQQRSGRRGLGYFRVVEWAVVSLYRLNKSVALRPIFYAAVAFSFPA